MKYIDKLHLLNRFEFWFLKRIIARIVQSGGHEYRIIGLYGLIREATEKEFTENNYPTTDDFLRQCFEETQWDSQY